MKIIFEERQSDSPFVEKSLAQPGGARLAQTIVRLGLVDEYHFYVYPVVSAGMTWFDQINTGCDLELLSVTTYEGGVVGLYYKSKND